LVQSRREHQSSGVDTTSIAFVQTSSHDCSTECEKRAQSISCSDESEATLSAHVCLPLAPDNSNSPSCMDENRIVVAAVSQTTSTGELTLVVPCCESLVTEECVPLSSDICTPSLSPRRESTQTISCSDNSVTDGELHGHCECANSSVLVYASVAPEDTASTRSSVIVVENTQKPGPASDDIQNTSFNTSTLTTAESLTTDRHEEPCAQDVARDRPTEVSSYVFPVLCLPST
jgi:hypothetical protein